MLEFYLDYRVFNKRMFVLRNSKFGRLMSNTRSLGQIKDNVGHNVHPIITKLTQNVNMVVWMTKVTINHYQYFRDFSLTLVSV